MNPWRLDLWRRHMHASRLIGRGDYAAAGVVYEQLIATDAQDHWATMMLSLCYERQGRHQEALALAEKGVQQLPSSLHALQSVVRLAVACGEHDKAALYIRQALALPEVRTEMPKEGLMPQPVLWLLRLMPHLPILGKRMRRDAVSRFEPGAQAKALEDWKRWADRYLEWRQGEAIPDAADRVVH